MNILLRRYPSIKDLERLAEFNLLQNLHLCTQKSVCGMDFVHFGQIGANFSLQLSSRTQFAIIKNKKVFAENICKKQNTAKQNSLNCFWEALPNTLALNFKIHKYLHWVVG